jgi:hypothetical protein
MAKRKARKTANAVIGPSPADEEKWKIDGACDTLRRAADIQADRNLMGKVKKKFRTEQQNVDRMLTGKK